MTSKDDEVGRYERDGEQIVDYRSDERPTLFGVLLPDNVHAMVMVTKVAREDVALEEMPDPSGEVVACGMALDKDIDQIGVLEVVHAAVCAAITDLKQHQAAAEAAARAAQN